MLTLYQCGTCGAEYRLVAAKREASGGVTPLEPGTAIPCREDGCDGQMSPIGLADGPPGRVGVADVVHRLPRTCDRPGCVAPARRLIHWRDQDGSAGRTWACEADVEQLRQERFDAGCTVIGPILPPTGNGVFDAAPVLHPDDRGKGAWDAR